MELNEPLYQELEREFLLLEAGTYPGEIIGIGDIRNTLSGRQFYMPIGIKLENGREFRDFVGGYESVLKALKKCEPYLTGKKVVVKIGTRAYQDMVYNTAQIDWDEAFEELNGIS